MLQTLIYDAIISSVLVFCEQLGAFLSISGYFGAIQCIF
jgi:hypothetical protein